VSPRALGEEEAAHGLRISHLVTSRSDVGRGGIQELRDREAGMEVHVSVDQQGDAQVGLLEMSPRYQTEMA
jgi:hypothetical protein